MERQWASGAQLIMDQAQHFDIASLLSCLHQLKSENERLEERVKQLIARRDHLIAINSRLALPLNGAFSASLASMMNLPSHTNPLLSQNLSPSNSGLNFSSPSSTNHSPASASTPIFQRTTGFSSNNNFQSTSTPSHAQSNGDLNGQLPIYSNISSSFNMSNNPESSIYQMMNAHHHLPPQHQSHQMIQQQHSTNYQQTSCIQGPEKR